MAVHNGGAYLRDTMESVLAQTMPDFELIVIDDVSTDETPATLAGYVARDPRVIVLRNDRNLGPYPSANRALAMARAPLVARIDADDLCEPDRLARQVAFMEANPDHLICGGGYVSIDGEGRQRFVRRTPMVAPVAGFVARLRMPMVHPGFCFRRHLPDGTPVRYGEDFPVAQDFALAARLAGLGRIAVLDGVLVRYRMHAANISMTRRAEQDLMARRVSGEAVAAHYPAEIAGGLAGLLDCYFRQQAATAAGIAPAARALGAALRHDDPQDPAARRAMRRMAAGILAEAFIGRARGVARLAMVARFAISAPDFAVPLVCRLVEDKGLLPGGPAPAEPSV